jgi:hypothetical protein
MLVYTVPQYIHKRQAKQMIDKTKPAEAGLFFETLVRTFQQGKAVSARGLSAGSTISTTRVSNAAIAALTTAEITSYRPYHPCRPYHPYQACQARHLLVLQQSCSLLSALSQQ